MAVVIPLKLVYTPVDATVTAIRNYQVPSTKRFRRCGGHVCALDRTKCQAGRWLAFGPRKCGWLRALTPPVCACVLVAVEMPLSSTFSAAAGATELLRGYKVAQKISLLAFSNVAEQGIGSRGHALAVGPSHCDYWL